MKARNIFLFVALILSLVLSSCAGTQENSGKISFMVFGDPAELAAYQSLVDTFHTKHPEIKVELIHIPGQSDYRKRLAADLTAGTPADVVLINYRRYAPFAALGALTPLDSYFNNSKLITKEDFYSESFDPFIYEGQLMCIPQNLSSLVVYYNKELFDQANVPYPAADWTWEDFLATAQALTKDTNDDGATDQFGVGIEASLIRFAPFVWQAGGDLVDDETNPTTLMLDTDEAFDAIDFFVSLQTVHHVVPNAEEEIAQDSESRFINGITAMFFNSRRGVPTYRESAVFDWDVAALPQGETKAGILHADGYCLPSASKNKNAAWVFIEFANSAEGQTIVAASGRTVPSLKAVANSPAFLDPKARPANSRVFLDTIPFMRALPVHANWAEIEDAAGEEIWRAFYGEADPYEALIRAVERSREVFALTQ
ncbi:MAG: sugar ABC transporter substrate-binding protein [Anaerolineaceae bacterium]|nr:MAG: sugar ABC transporter substrate-binding protein [Anaerolineaceae bacterium]